MDIIDIIYGALCQIRSIIGMTRRGNPSGKSIEDPIMIEFQSNPESFPFPFIFEIDFMMDEEENLFRAISDILDLCQIPSNHLIGIIDKGQIHNVSNTIELAFSDMKSAQKFIDHHCQDDDWMRGILYKESGVIGWDYDED